MKIKLQTSSGKTSTIDVQPSIPLSILNEHFEKLIAPHTLDDGYIAYNNKRLSEYFVPGMLKVKVSSQPDAFNLTNPVIQLTTKFSDFYKNLYKKVKNMRCLTASVDTDNNGNCAIRFGDKFSMSLKRTLRVPDDGKIYPLPPDLGDFPIREIDKYKDKIPKSWVSHGGVFFPMYQSEAMWIEFKASAPHAVKVAVGKINAVSGKTWKNGLNPQDYLVTPPQKWIDGINCANGKARQFVAMPLGEGYTVEGQLTGKEKFGGIQIQVIPMVNKDVKFFRRREYSQKFMLPLDKTPQEVGLKDGDEIYMRSETLLGKRGLSFEDIEDGSKFTFEVTNYIIFCQRPNERKFYKVKVSPSDIPYRIRVLLKSQGVVLKPNEILKYNNQTLTGGKLETYNITDFALIDIEENTPSTQQSTQKKTTPNPQGMLPFFNLNLGASRPDQVPMDNTSMEAFAAAIAGVVNKTSVSTPAKSNTKPSVENTNKSLEISEPELPKSIEMGIAAGGKMKQKIYKDTYGIDSWDLDLSGRIYIHIVNSEMWQQITDENNPAEPIDAKTYISYGFPWFDNYDENFKVEEGSSVLAGVKSIKEIDKERGNDEAIRDGDWGDDEEEEEAIVTKSIRKPQTEPPTKPSKNSTTKSQSDKQHVDPQLSTLLAKGIKGINDIFSSFTDKDNERLL